MKRNSNDEWNETDVTWKLLGKAAPTEVSGSFTDDAVRAVRLLPETRSWFSTVGFFAPWLAVAGCGVLASFFFLNGDDVSRPVSGSVVMVSLEREWDEIEEVADAEILVAAVDHLDEFSDYELVSLIGF